MCNAGGVVILLLEFVRGFTKKRKEHWVYFILVAIILGEAAAVCLFMPEGRPAYLYPVLYTSYLLIFLYLIDMYVGKWKKHVNNREN
jgi:hypothetical protein